MKSRNTAKPKKTVQAVQHRNGKVIFAANNGDRISIRMFTDILLEPCGLPVILSAD